MDETALEIIKITLGFGQNLILLIGSFFVAKYAVNHYQKAKDTNLIRESLLSLNAESILNSIRLLVTSIQYSTELQVLNNKLQQIVAEIREAIDEERPAKEREVIASEYELRIQTLHQTYPNSKTKSDLITALGEYDASMGLLLSRMRFQLELNENDLDVVNSHEDIIKLLRISTMAKIDLSGSLMDDFKDIGKAKKIIEADQRIIEELYRSIQKIEHFPEILLTTQIKI